MRTIPVGCEGRLSMEFDEKSRKASFAVDANVGNPTGCERKFTSLYKVSCKVSSIPGTLLTHFEFVIEVPDVKDILTNPVGYLQKVHQDLTRIIRSLDRFSL